MGKSEPEDITPLFMRDDVLYGSSSEYYIYKSINLGYNWEAMGFKIKDYTEFNFDFIQNNIIIPIKNGVKVSSDLGAKFEEFIIDTNTINTKSFKLNDIAIQGDYLIATSSEGIWRAKLSDLGIFPTSVDSGIENNYLYTLPPMRINTFALNLKNDKDILSRFKKLFRTSGLKKSEFAERIDLSHQSLNNNFFYCASKSYYVETSF